MERVTSSTGLCLPAGFAPWSEPTGRSGASCDGILWLGELWGCTITGSTFPSPLTLLAVVFVGQGAGGRGSGRVGSRCVPRHEGSAATHEDAEFSNITARKGVCSFRF